MSKLIPHAGMNGTSLLKISPDEYHRDPCLTPSLSASIAWTLVDESPLHAWAQHPRLGAVSRPPTEATERGDLFHRMLLGAGKSLEVIDARDYKTAAAREARDAAREAGRIPVLREVHDDASSACRIIEGRLDDLGIKLKPARSEIGIFWVDQTSSGEPVQCRALVDQWQPPIEYDLKSISRMSTDAIASAIAEHGYHLQRAAYRRALEANAPKLVGRIKQRLIFFETAAPFDVVIVPLSALFLDLGETLWQRAIDTWADCLRSGHWPGVAGDADLVPIDPPPWLLKRWQEPA